MTTTADAGSLGDDDIRAFGPPAVAMPRAEPPAQPPAKKRRVWPWLLLAAALLGVIGALVLAVQLVGHVGSGVGDWHVSTDDGDWFFDGAGSAFGAALAIGITAIVLLFVGAFLVVLFPMLLIVVLAAVALAVGVPLALLLLLLAVLTSPLWLPIALLVWWLA